MVLGLRGGVEQLGERVVDWLRVRLELDAESVVGPLDVAQSLPVHQRLQHLGAQLQLPELPA